jgi:hypothetical protein
MSRQSAWVVLAVVASVLALFAGFFGLQRGPAAARPQPGAAAVPSAARAPNEPLPPVVLAPPVPSAPPPSASASDPALLDEPTLMTTLRELRSSDPNRTLSLARQGNERFRASSDAGERAWFVVKALTDLGRHDEARLEGRALLEQYRGTRWAEDVYRHLFVNPGTHPFERGYGKQLETDP